MNKLLLTPEEAAEGPFDREDKGLHTHGGRRSDGLREN